MSMGLPEILAAARALPAIERETLCVQIAESLDTPMTANEQAWADIAQRRAEELATGKVQGVPAEELFVRARRAVSVIGTKL